MLFNKKYPVFKIITLFFGINTIFGTLPLQAWFFGSNNWFRPGFLTTTSKTSSNNPIIEAIKSNSGVKNQNAAPFDPSHSAGIFQPKEGNSISLKETSSAVQPQRYSPEKELAFAVGNAFTNGALKLVSQECQEVFYGSEELDNQAIITTIREVLKELQVPDYETIPLRKKQGTFSTSFFDALILHPTNKCIFVNQHALESLDANQQLFVIKTALAHKLNATYFKTSVACIGFSCLAAYAIKKLMPFTIHKLGDAYPAINSNSWTGTITRYATSMALGSICASIVNKTQQSLTNSYVAHKQKEIDQKVMDNSASMLLSCSVKQNISDYHPSIKQIFKERALNIKPQIIKEAENAISLYKDEVKNLKSSKDCVKLIAKMNEIFNQINQKPTVQIALQSLMKDTLDKMNGFNSEVINNSFSHKEEEQYKVTV